jgi:hypothetical protein
MNDELIESQNIKGEKSNMFRGAEDGDQQRPFFLGRKVQDFRDRSHTYKAQNKFGLLFNPLLNTNV